MVALGIMGHNLLLNFTDHEFSEVSYDEVTAKVKRLEEYFFKPLKEMDQLNMLANTSLVVYRARFINCIRSIATKGDTCISIAN